MAETLIEQGCIRAVAGLLLGEPNERLSSAHELRYGSHGSLAIDLHKDCWHDHEQNEGGGVLDLIRRCEGLGSRAEQLAWLQQHGIAVPRPKPARAPQSRIAATYDYRDETGLLVFQVVRMVPKTFRQRRLDDNGNWEWKVRGTRQVPYRLPELVAAPADALVFVVEGEKDADRLATLGMVATCNAGGAGKWRKEHAQALQGRRVVIVPDNDDAGRDHAQKVAKSLQGVAADVRTVLLPDLADKGDVSDWLDAGGTPEALHALANAAQQAAPAEVEEERKRSQTDLLVAFAQERFDLLHDGNGDVYAKDRGTGEVRRLGGRQFKDRLVSAFYRQTGLAVREQALGEAMGTLRALGRFNGAPQEVHIRMAGRDGRYFIDLCQAGNSQAVELDASGWRVVERPPVLFVRGESMQPLPTPVHGGSIAPLWAIANVPEDMRLLVLAWLIDSMRPETPFPGLELIGEQGSGKSTAAEALRRLIDPNACNLRGAPKTTEDIFVAAAQNHVVAYENVSHLAGPMQDALAILSTGGGFAKRQLYTDGDEHVISVRRPWMVNGISISVTQQDLVDRVISIECPVIETRQSSSQQWRAFDAALPGILGALLDTASQALALLPAMQLPREDRPRLVEFVLLGMAVAQACGHAPADFLQQFRETRAETVARTLDASPVASAVLDLIEDEPQGITAPVKELMHRLERYKPQGADAWPRSPKGLGDALRRAAPALRQMDVEVKSLGNIGGKVRWTIKKNLSSPSRACREVVPEGDGQHDFMTCMTLGREVSSDQKNFSAPATTPREVL